MGIKEFEQRFGKQVFNWLRWGKRRDWLPGSHVCLLGKRMVSGRRESGVRYEAVNTLEAARMEKLVSALPPRNRQAFLLYYVGKASIDGKMRQSRCRDDCASLMGIGVWQYHNLIRQANMILADGWQE